MKKVPDIFSLIKKDHRTVKQVFSQVDKTSEKAPKKRHKIYAKIKEELTRHSHGEEVAIYPALKENEKTKDIGWESVEEHNVVKYLFARIDEVSPEQPDWTALVTVLKEVVEHHVEEEEEEMFAKMRRAFDRDELAEMAQEFLAAKKETELESDGAPVLPSVGSRSRGAMGAAA